MVDGGINVFSVLKKNDMKKNEVDLEFTVQCILHEYIVVYFHSLINPIWIASTGKFPPPTQ